MTKLLQSHLCQAQAAFITLSKATKTLANTKLCWPEREAANKRSKLQLTCNSFLSNSFPFTPPPPSHFLDVTRNSQFGPKCVPLVQYFDLKHWRRSPSNDQNAESDNHNADNLGPQFRPGAYACVCPKKWPHVSAPAKWAQQNRRQQLIELASQTMAASELGTGPVLDLLGSSGGGTHSASPSAGPDETRLADKRWVAQVLAATATAAKPVPLGANSQIGTPTKDELQQNPGQEGGLAAAAAAAVDGNQVELKPGTRQYFSLGAQLELEAALVWLAANSSTGQQWQQQWDWPPFVCQLCGPPLQAKLSAERQGQQRDKIGGAKLDALQAGVQADELDAKDGPGHDNCSASSWLDGGHESQLRQAELEPMSWAGDTEFEWKYRSPPAPIAWVRPIALTLQIVCLLITLALIGVILRIRKSRVSSASRWLKCLI